jgi:heptosyltransferase-2
MLLLNDPNIDELFAFKRSKPIFFRRDATGSITQNIRIGHYDLGILLTNSFSSAWWFFQGDVKTRIGYKNFPRDFLLTKSVKKPKKSTPIHQVDEYFQLLHLIGIHEKAHEPKLYLQPIEKDEAKAKLKLYGIDFQKKRIGISAGAAYGVTKCWPKENFIELIKKFAGKKDSPQFVFFGDQMQVGMIEEICSKYPHHVLNLASKTTIRELMAMIEHMDLFLSNDSGPMHIAEALGRPTLAIFGSTSPERTGPYRNGKVLYKKVSCSPCYKRVCPIDFRCMKEISVEQVYHEIQTILESK